MNPSIRSLLTCPLAALFLLAIPPPACRAEDPQASAFARLAQADVTLPALATQPPLKRAQALMELGLAAQQVYAWPAAADYHRRALEALRSQPPVPPGALQQLLTLLFQAQHASGQWAQAAATQAELLTLLEGAGAGSSPAALEALLKRWRALTQAGETEAAKVVETQLRTRADEGQWTRRLDLEKTRQGPLALLPLRGYRAYLFVDGTGRVVSDAFSRAEPFANGSARVFAGTGWGTVDDRLRFLVPPRFHALRPVLNHPERFYADLPVSPGVVRTGVLEDRGKFLLPVEFVFAENYGTDVVEVRRNQPGESEFYRLDDGTRVDQATLEAAKRRAARETGSFAPYEFAREGDLATLRDATGRRIFPPDPVPEVLKGYSEIHHVDGDLVICVDTYFPGKDRSGASLRRFLAWDLAKGERAFSVQGLDRLGRFHDGLALAAEGIQGHQGVLRADGTWQVEPRWKSPQQLPGMEQVVRVQDGPRDRLFRLTGEPFSERDFKAIFTPGAGLIPAWIRGSVPNLGLGQEEDAHFPTLLDSQGKLLWDDGRIRLEDDQLSVLLPEDLTFQVYTLGRLAGKRAALRQGRFSAVDYPFEVQISIEILDRSPGDDAAKITERVQRQSLGSIQGIQTKAWPELEASGRQWSRTAVFLPASPSTYGHAYGQIAVHLAAKQAYVLLLWGGSTQDDPQVSDPLARRMENLIRSLRLPGEPGF